MAAEVRPLTAAVEGMLDEAVVRKLVEDAGGVVGDVHVKRGKRPLREKILGYNNAAQRARWFVLADLDRDYECAAELVADWLPSPADGMHLRVAVRAIESWFLADRNRMASFLGVPVSRVPKEPDRQSDPKGLLVDIARSSKRRGIREDLVPTPRGGRRTGPGYVSRLFDFVQDSWDLDTASESSPSLDRCRSRLRELVG
jgi:hypothetical protein